MATSQKDGDFTHLFFFHQFHIHTEVLLQFTSFSTPSFLKRKADLWDHRAVCVYKRVHAHTHTFVSIFKILKKLAVFFPNSMNIMAS
jgi:hypothetical protein